MVLCKEPTVAEETGLEPARDFSRRFSKPVRYQFRALLRNDIYNLAFLVFFR